MRMNMIKIVILSLCVCMSAGQMRLPHLNISRNQISVSGVSSGAAMATQFHVIHSRNVMGAAILAGAPYACAEVFDALTCMGDPDGINVGDLLRYVDEAAGRGDIDPVSNMRNDRVFAFNGALDSVVARGIGQRVADFYNQMPVGNVQTELDLQAEHGFPTMDRGIPCTEIGGDYINRCQYDGAYQALNQIYQGLTAGPSTPTGRVEEFRQDDVFSFTPPALSSMDDIGYIYIPARCRDGSVACKLHIAYHGCVQGREEVEDRFVSQAGYNEVAELNDIVILYPQAIGTLVPVNPQGCWDWWGYTVAYDTKDGPQILAVKRMVDRLVDGIWPDVTDTRL